MADVRDWGRLIRGRWDWAGAGMEAGFPRGCAFGDIDAVVEIDGRRLIIEPKHYDGTGQLPGDGYPPGVAPGQARYLRHEAAAAGTTVIVLYSCGPCASPHAAIILAASRPGDRFEDWRGLAKQSRRKLLKVEIDRALGLR